LLPPSTDTSRIADSDLWSILRKKKPPPLSRRRFDFVVCVVCFMCNFCFVSARDQRIYGASDVGQGRSQGRKASSRQRPRSPRREGEKACQGEEEEEEEECFFFVVFVLNSFQPRSPTRSGGNNNNAVKSSEKKNTAAAAAPNTNKSAKVMPRCLGSMMICKCSFFQPAVAAAAAAAAAAAPAPSQVWKVFV
jgi:hypothetical protein